MSFLCIFCVLVLEQFRAAPAARLAALLDAHAALLERYFNGGERRHEVTAWSIGVILPAVLVALAQFALAAVHPVLGFVFAVALLYFLIGFRQFSHSFTEIQLALRMGELERARSLLADWRGSSADRFSSADIARLAIEQGILASHRHVFAPLFWFIALGPAGALLYRLALGLAERWSGGSQAGEAAQFGSFAREAFQWLDWLPARLTAITFAIVGDFEDAVYCWRTQAAQWHDAASGILLASGAGALGVKLGQPLPDATGFEMRPELGLGDDAEVGHLQSAIGLVWRALVLCLLMLALLTLASWLG